MTAPIRVAQVMGYMNGAGVESVVMNYYRHIDRSKVQFDLIVCEGSHFVPRDEVEALGGRVFMVPPYSHVVEFQRALQRLFREEQWKIVHSHINALSVFPLHAAKKAGVPVRIAHSHSTSGKGEYAKNVVKALLKTQANRYPTERFACSKFAGEWLYGTETDFKVVYNAIDLDRYSFAPEMRAKARAELGLDTGRFAIGHVGRFVAQKNHAFLIDAFEQVARRRDDAVLLLVGAGEAKLFVKRLVVERGLSERVKFLGQRTDMPEIYAAFDLFVLPSLYEGLGLAAIEAQRSGLPCLLSDKVPHEVNVVGECRSLSIDDPSAWADAICGIKARGDSERIVVDGDVFVDYDIEKASAELCGLYLRLNKKTASI